MSDENTVLSPKSIQKMKVADLKRELKNRGLNVNGNKNELVDRLMQAIDGSKVDDTSVDDLIDEDDVLNDEELESEVADMSEKNLDLDGDKTSEVSNTSSSKILKRKSSEIERTDSVDSTNKAKKIILNRHLSDDVDQSNEAESNVTETETTEKSNDNKVVKLSDLSAKERLEMRAKKFGVDVPTDAKKLARAERFGTTATTNTTSNGKQKISITNTAADLDVLKKRAERFGSVVSTELTKAQLQEKMEQRKARFGSNGTLTSSSNQEEQKAKRLERFKTSLK